MTCDSLPARSLFLMLAAAVTLAILMSVAGMAGRAPSRRLDPQLSPVLLTGLRPAPAPQPAPERQAPHPPRTRELPPPPPEPPRLAPQPPAPRPVLETPRIPKPRFEIAPRLATGPTVPAPAPAPVPKSVPKPAPTPAPEPVVSTPEKTVAKAPATPAPVRSVPPRPSTFEVGEVDQAPGILKKVPPKYPYTARRRNITGQVLVRFLVNEDGAVTRPAILEAEPRGVFEKAVLQALNHWRFTPGYFEGKPVPTWVVLPIRFNLSG